MQNKKPITLKWLTKKTEWASFLLDVNFGFQSFPIKFGPIMRKCYLVLHRIFDKLNRITSSQVVILLTPSMHKSKEYSLIKVVFPEPVGPVNTVNSPRRCPFKYLTNKGYLFHCTKNYYKLLTEHQILFSWLFFIKLISAHFNSRYLFHVWKFSEHILSEGIKWCDGFMSHRMGRFEYIA